MTEKSFLHIEVPQSSKAAWVRAAQHSGMNLTDWVTRTLDVEADNTRPPWTEGLSSRTAQCLSRTGFCTRAEVEREWAKQPREWWVSLPNFGVKCYAELEQWLK
jgi:hypothetical protein